MHRASNAALGLYKVATGEDISKAEKPGMFDLKVRFSSVLEA